MGEYITCQIDFKENDLELDLTTVCDCSRFNGLWGLHIHKACWSKQHNSSTGEYKSNDGVMNLDDTHSVQDPSVEWQCPREILSQPRIQQPKSNKKSIWTNLDWELKFILTINLKGLIGQQIVFFCKIIWRLLWFGLA